MYYKLMLQYQLVNPIKDTLLYTKNEHFSMPKFSAIGGAPFYPKYYIIFMSLGEIYIHTSKQKRIKTNLS